MVSSVTDRRSTTTSAVVSKIVDPNRRIDVLRKELGIDPSQQFEFIERSKIGHPLRGSLLQMPFDLISPALIKNRLMIAVINDVPVLVAKVSYTIMLYFIQKKDITLNTEQEKRKFRCCWIKWEKEPNSGWKVNNKGLLPLRQHEDTDNLKSLPALLRGEKVEVALYSPEAEPLERYRIVLMNLQDFS